MGVRSSRPSRSPGCKTLTRRSHRTAGCAWSMLRGRAGLDVRGGRGRLERGQVDLLDVGAAAGGRRAREQGRTLACRAGPPRRARTEVPSGAGRRCRPRSASGAGAPAGARRRLADEPDIARHHWNVHRVQRRGGCSRRPRPAARGGGPLRVAQTRRPAAHGHRSGRGRFEATDHAVTVDRSSSARAERAGGYICCAFLHARPTTSLSGRRNRPSPSAPPVTAA